MTVSIGTGVSTGNLVTVETNPPTGGSTFLVNGVRNGIIKYDTPQQGALLVPRSALSIAPQTIWRVSSTELNVFSNVGNNIWLRGLKTGVFTSSGSVGVASQFWRLLKLIKLQGAVAIPTANETPLSAGSFTAAARSIYPGSVDSGQTTGAGVVFGSSTQNDVITWTVTVPTSGVIKVLLFNSPSTAQNYTVSCGGQSKSGTLIQSTVASTILPQIITLSGCTTGSQTLSVTKTNTGSTLYTAGQCIDVTVNANSTVAASSIIYWFDPANKYVDGPGSNEIALNIGGTFAGSYHGGHYGSTVFKLDGIVTDLLSNGPVFTGNIIDIVQDGTITSVTIGAITRLYSDGHTFDIGLRDSALTMTEIKVLLMGCVADMTYLNGLLETADSLYHTVTRTTYLDKYNASRTKAMTGYIESLKVNGSDPNNLFTEYVNTGVGGYSKGYCTIPITSLTSLDMRTVWTY